MPERAAAHRQELVRRLAPIDRLDAFDVPELVDENHDGRPYYRSGDTRPFARALSQDLRRPVLVNKVVAHLPSSAALQRWAEETLAQGLLGQVFVGGSSRYIPYPGPTVLEADRLCGPLLARAGGVLGNIAIPQRVGEAHRMLAKTRAGAAFFTTQIVFDGELVLKLLREYDGLCRQSGLAPSSVLISLAPIADEGDTEFVRWLGADIPESAERAILNGDDAEASVRSVRHALGVWKAVRDGAKRLALEIPVGVNVEQVTQRHLGAAVEMLQAIAAEIDAGPTD